MVINFMCGGIKWLKRYYTMFTGVTMNYYWLYGVIGMVRGLSFVTGAYSVTILYCPVIFGRVK